MAASLPSYKVNFTDFFTGSFTIQPFTNNGTISPTIGSPLDPFALGANTSLVLYGKGSPNYGERTDENLINILESFYGSTEPAHAINGQLWFASIGYWLDTITMTLYRFVESSQTWTAIPPGDFAVGFADPIGDPGAGEKYAFNDTPGNKTLFFWYTEFSKWLPRLYTARTVAPVDGTDFADKELIVCDDISVTSPQTGEGFSGKWRRVLKVNNSTVPPTNPSPGELWYDPSLPQLNTWNGLTWVSVADRYVLKAGDVMTGFLFLNADPTLPLHAATKNYVDTQIGFFGADGVVLSGVLNPGGTLQLNMSAAAPTNPVLITGFAEAVHTHPASDITFTPSGNISATDVQAALVELDTEKAPINAPTFTGVSTFSGNAVFSVGATVSGSNTILLGRDPLLPLEAATKDYVDDSIASIVGTDNTQSIMRTVRTGTGLALYTGLPVYTVYANMLSVFVNGVKQLNNVRGEQRVSLSGFNDANDPTGLRVDPIVSVSSGPPFTGSFTIGGGDFTTTYVAGASVEVRNSTGNDGLYTVSIGGSTFNIGPNETTIPVDEAVPSNTPPFGDISPIYKTNITVDGGAPQLINVPGFDAPLYIDLINLINLALVGGISAFTPIAIRVISHSSGALSSIIISDGTPPLFGSVLNFNVFLTPIAGASYAYNENGNTFFDISTSITFESGSEPIIGSIIEFIVSTIEETIPGGDDLTAIEALNTNGILTRIASNTWAARAIVAGSLKIAITDGNGVAGNPSVDFGIVDLNDLDDVVITAPAITEVLTFDGINWVNSPSTGGGGTPGGVNTEIQYNDTGTFGGDADFTWNDTTNTLAIGGVISNAVGTAALPSYTFTGDLDTGMYHSAVDQVSVAIAGAEKIRFSSTGITVFSGFFSPGANTPLTPEFSFTNDTDTGIFRSAADTIDLTTGGISRMSIGSTGITFTTPLNLGSNTLTANTFVGAQGGAATPSFTFNTDTDTGLYTATPNNLFVGTGATRRWTWDSTGNAIIHAGGAALLTTATDGFLYISTMAGTPTGVPTSYAGRAPIVLDITNNKLYGYDGTWIDLTGTSGGTPGGANTQVQYNDTGTFGGDPDFTWDDTTNTLSVAGDIIVGDEVRFLEPGGPNYVGFRAGPLTANTIWRLPLVDGTSGELLSTDGTGNLTFITASGTGTVTSVSANQPSSGFTITGSPITTSGAFTFTLNNDLAALEGMTGTGIAVRDMPNSWTTRSIVAGSSNIVVTNGSGVSGNPSLELGSTVNTSTFVGAQTGASAPSFTFNGDTNTGLYTATPDNLFVGTGGARRWTWDANGNAVIQAGPIATTATDGFLYISTTAGTPTGIPTTYSGRSALVVDTLNNRLYGYDPVDNMWLNLTGGGGGTPGGADTHVQFNDSGSFGGDPDFTWNKTTNTLTIVGTGTLAMQDGTISRPLFKDYAEVRTTPLVSAGSLTLNIENGNTFDVTLDQNVTTLTVSNPPASGNAGSFTFIIRQDGTGGRTITWPAAFVFPGGTPPALSTAPNSVDIFTFLTVNAGTTWYGNITQGGITVAGSNTQIQFNDSGSFGGDADLTWNKTTNTLTIVGSGTLAMQDATLSRPHLKDYSEERSTPPGAGPTLTINLEDGNTAEVTLTGNISTVTVSNPPISGRAGNFTLIVHQDATGGRTITWPTLFKFAGGTDPTLSTGANALDILTFITTDAGTSWYGFFAGANLS